MSESDEYWREMQWRADHGLTPKPVNIENTVPPHRPLDEIIGEQVSPEEEKAYANDYQNRGYTLPGTNYEGPGNSLNRGRPTTEADKWSQLHDANYSHAKWLYEHGEIDEDQYNKAIENADKDYVKKLFNNSGIDGVLGRDGIQLKRWLEKAFGRVYPSISESERQLHVAHYLQNEQYKNQKPDEYKHLSEAHEKLKSYASQMETDSQNPLKRTLQDNTVSSSDAKITRLTPVNGQSGSSVQNIPSSAGLNATPQGTTGGTSTALNAQGDSPITQEMGLTGTAKGQSSGGASSDGMTKYQIERPISLFSNKTSTYKKVHKFMTFGFAETIISNGTATLGNRYLTSYLAEVPWHLPVLYLNPSEFALLQDGSSVEEVSIEVFYRGSTIQFETGSSATGLATLNQINDIAVAEGLNHTGWGQNISFGNFNSTQPMIPTEINEPKYSADTTGTLTYRGIISDYYGENNDNANFSSFIPKQQVGRQTFLYNYWSTTTRNAATGTTAANRTFGGWPCIQEKIHQMDGKTVVNTCVLKASYKPKMAPLKPTFGIQNHGFPWPVQNASINVPVGGSLPSNRNCVVTHLNTAPSSSATVPTQTSETSISLTSNAQPSYSLLTPIEKSQICKSGFWGELEPKSQPSVHIGVQPVPSLSSSNILVGNAAFNNWSDTRAYWEVVATMKVKEHVPTAYPYAQVGNVPPGEAVQFIPSGNRPSIFTKPENDAATFAGLYPVEFVSIPEFNPPLNN